MCGFSAVTSISERCTSSVMRSRLGSMPTAQWSLKLFMPSASRRTLCRKLCETMGRNTFSSKLPEAPRSEEHTSELQSPCNLVCRLLLEKKKKQTSSAHNIQSHITDDLPSHTDL